MNRRRMLAFGFSGLPILGGCSFWDPRIIRFRLGVLARVAGATHQASSIFECHWYRYWIALPETGKWAGYRFGDALSLDLGAGRTLFALWDRVSWNEKNSFGGSIQDVLNILPAEWGTRVSVDSEATLDALATSTNEVTLPKVEWPQFVYFSNVRDIRTARLVSLNDVESTLGPGSAIEAVTLRVTHEPINRGIENNLPWWDKLGSFQDDVEVEHADADQTYRELRKSNFHS